MKITALLEPLVERQFRVTSMSPPQVSVDGTTRDEAVKRFRDAITERIAKAEVIEVDVPVLTRQDEWANVIGVLGDHPDFDQYLENIREYRRQIDTDPC